MAKGKKMVRSEEERLPDEGLVGQLINLAMRLAPAVNGRGNGSLAETKDMRRFKRLKAEVLRRLKTRHRIS